MLGTSSDLFNQDSQVKKIIVRVSKEDSSFLYFTLEANEGLCFYSTLKSSEGTNFRDVEIYVPTDLQKNLISELGYLEKFMNITYLENQCS